MMADEMDKKEPARQLQVKEYKGTYMWDCCEIEKFSSFKCRDGDIWVCSFPRSGTTLTQQMTYLVRTLDFEKGSTVDLDHRFPVADGLDKGYPYLRGLGYLDGLPRDEPRLIKSHIHHFLLPDELLNGKGKIIYVTRNPKSTICSLYKLLHYMKNNPAPSLRVYIERFLTGKDVYTCPWGLHVRQFWEQRDNPNVLFLQFEKIIKDRRETIKQIANFLDRDLTEEQIDRVLEETSLQSMKSNNSCNFLYFEDTFVTDDTEGAFINKGEISGWRNEIPEDLVPKMDEMIRRELGHTDIKYE